MAPDRNARTDILRYDADQERLVLREARLAVQPPEGPAFSFSLSRRETVIGSDPACDLALEDRYVSASHAVLRAEERGFILEDLGSTNGTLIAGMRIGRATLTPGAEFVLGKTRLRLECGEAPLGEALPDDRGGFVGESRAIRGVLSVLAKVAPSDLPVLLTGETGTGKELAARFLHARSRRAAGPFLAINCSAVTAELFESELFGHERGAFTSATATRVGLLEICREGTLFLDEVGEMPIALQPKLLRVLDEQRIRRVGGNREIATDVRILAATNRDLAAQVRAGAFRRDLFYRLSAVPVTLPPLRDREGDILLLARHFLELETHKRGAAAPFTLAADAQERLLAYAWPGNVRELRNVIAAACQLAERPPVIHARDLRFSPVDAEAAETPRTLEEIEADAIRRAIARAGGSTREAARALGLPLSTMYDRMKKHGIPAGGSKKP